MDLFVRKVNNVVKYNQFVDNIKKQLNLYTLTSFTSKKTLKLYREEYEEEFLVYRFSLLKQWISINERFTKAYVKTLNDILKNLLLNENLNGYELDYIDYYNQVVFDKTRNLKNLIVDFAILDNEEIYYKFDIDVLGQHRGENNVDILFENNEIFITEKRLVAVNKEYYYSIFFSNIKYFKIKNFCLEIQEENGVNIWIFAPNVHAIYVSLERILKMLNSKGKKNGWKFKR